MSQSGTHCKDCNRAFRLEVKHEARGLCSACYTKRRRRGEISPVSRVDLFLEKVAKRENGCWEWLGPTVKQGYGRCGFKSMSRLAHRASYTLFVGPVDPDKDVNHMCSNLLCVNPDHLALLTRQEHIRETPKSNAYNAYTANTCKNGHPFTNENTYTRADGGRSCRACARQRERKKWKEEEPRHARFTGLRWKRTTHRWVVFINHDGKVHYIGAFSDELEAARAWNRAALKLRGPKARLNPV